MATKVKSEPCKVYKKTSAGREEAGTHELYRVLGREPNPDMDSFTFWEMMTHWWINYGNAYAEKVTTSSSGRGAKPETAWATRQAPYWAG
jgi:phage portal protein BeeE